MDQLSVSIEFIFLIVLIFIMEIFSKFTTDEALSYNEAKVRMQIIDPIIKKLGYTDNPRLYFELEETLRYPYYHIGHKNKKTDVPIGKMDYRAGLKGRRGCFVVEAKSGSASIGVEDIEQAHSYAAHALVGANFFVLCNGTNFQIFETLSGHNTLPIVDLHLDSINDRFHEIEAILAPNRLEKYCLTEYDLGLPLCRGLGSRLAVHGGYYTSPIMEVEIRVGDIDVTSEALSAPAMKTFRDNISLLRNMRMMISEGEITRDHEGRIQVKVKFDGLTAGNDANLRALGLQELQFTTDSETLSYSSNAPTVFESDSAFALKRGAEIFEMFAEAASISEHDIDGKLYLGAQLYLDGETFIGEYAGVTTIRLNTPYPKQIHLKMVFGGEVLGRVG